MNESLLKDARDLSAFGHDVVASQSLLSQYDIKAIAHAAARVGDCLASNFGPFKRHIEYRFECGRYQTEYAISPHPTNANSIDIEETRKNGQEDDHEEGALVFEDGRWKWCWGQESFYPETATAIIEFLTNNQLPF